MDEILSNLNEEQLDAVTTTEGYVRVIAGAGSGKTKALTHRYAYLVNELGMSTANILCVTFTNKAANEMKKRIRSMIGDNDTGFVCTFHGFCVQLLREDIHAVNYPQNFMVLDSEDAESILKTVYESSGIQSRTYTFNMAREDIRKRKTTRDKQNIFHHLPHLIDLDTEKLKKAYENEEDVKKKVYLGYLYEQKKCYGLDFDDLITVALHILETNEDIRKKWQERMMYIMVDEFQDVSALNYQLADVLSAYHKNLFIVGDPDQTIYSWRGAKVEYILDFDKTHQDTKTILLNKNYRSSPEILNAANSLIKKNQKRMDKDLIAVKGKNVPTVFNHAKTTRAEAEWLVSQIKTLISGGNRYNDISILYRAHFVSRSIEEMFIKEKIPYVLYSGIEFYKRKEIKDAISYLRMILYADDLSFQRVVNEPKRNIGKRRISFLKEYAEAHHCSLYHALKENLEDKLFAATGAENFISVVEKYRGNYKEMRVSGMITGILNDSGYEAMLRQGGEQERLDNLSELKQSIFEFETTSGEENTLEEYIQSIALFTNSDKDEKRDSVKMMTIHTAKGLEFPYVFVCGLNEGIFPTKHADTQDKLEEERRLAYVAYTRAENALFLSDAEGINYDGSFRYPSRFIFNTEKAYLNYIVELEEKLVHDSNNYIQNDEKRFMSSSSTLEAGDTVQHSVFGKGEIVEIREDISSYVIQFEKLATTRNISFKTPLHKI
ncbi:MAG: UvrD-helicase domain-containing protein [Candidatus Gastranaerophilales bacterium]|nr:UvrD-helicase domain-containing protein [Candidatus Gastranaerophilales bacterium]